MKLVTFDAAGHSHLGALVGDEIVDLTAAGIAPSLLAFIAGGDDARTRARGVIDGPKLKRSSVALEVPLRPGKVLCCGVNYASHANENPSAKMPSEPFFFAKLPSSVTGPESAIVAPPATQQLDYEVEFAVVIGKRLTKAREADIMDAVFGYTLLNDVSARDVQFKDSQITLGKNFDNFAPIGPCVVTADELTKPERVRLTTRLNGQLMQDGNTSEWLFSLPRLLSFLSQVMVLEPGDVVTTGTPAGVGFFRSPQVFMRPGDIVEIEAEGIGVLRNRIVAA